MRSVVVAGASGPCHLKSVLHDNCQNTADADCAALFHSTLILVPSMVRDEGFLHLVSSDQNPQDPSSWISSKPQPIPNTNLRCPTTRVHRSALANSLIRRSGWARGTRSRVHDGQQAALGVGTTAHRGFLRSWILASQPATFFSNLLEHTHPDRRLRGDPQPAKARGSRHSDPIVRTPLQWTHGRYEPNRNPSGHRGT